MTQIALIDGPLDGPACPARAHARAMQRAILSGHPAADLTLFQVFRHQLSTSVETVVQALQAAAASDVQIVHCSFGLPRRDAALDAAINTLVSKGVCVVASHPARGSETVWPSSHPRVISVQGDVRCAAGDWSVLQLDPPLFGACAVEEDPSAGGASVAAAHFTGHLSRLMAQGAGLEHVQQRLWQDARWRGRERRTG